MFSVRPRPRYSSSARERSNARRYLPPNVKPTAFTRLRLEKNVTAAPGRRIVKGTPSVSLAELYGRRNTAISDAAPFRRALQAFTAKAAAADRRYWHPASEPTPKTVFGTEAWLHRAPLEVGKQFVFQAMNSLIVAPCVARAARREVLFALRLHKHGNHKRGKSRKRGPFQHMRC